MKEKIANIYIKVKLKYSMIIQKFLPLWIYNDCGERENVNI